MKMRDFNFHEPRTPEEACALLARHGTDARIIAGGTDLLVDLKQDNIRVHHLISLTKMEELKRIEMMGGELSIGALVTLNGVARSDLVLERIKALAEAAGSMASTQVRNAGTIGGNIASAVPSADIPPTLIAAGASVLLHDGKKERKVPLDEFFLGPRKTVLHGDEILTHITIPHQPEHSGIAYQKLKLRGANALAVAAVAARITIEKGTIKNGIIVLGAVAPIPLVAVEASAFLSGKIPCNEVFSEAAEIASGESRPISDIRGSEKYRKDIVKTLTSRALKEAYDRASKGGM